MKVWTTIEALGIGGHEALGIGFTTSARQLNSFDSPTLFFTLSFA